MRGALELPSRLPDRPRGTAPILFLDVDGVLNNVPHLRVYGSGTICQDNATELARVVAATDCRLVISSAWRYQIHGGAVTQDGFSYMLHSHGIKVRGKVVGATRRDVRDNEDATPEQIEADTRGAQISMWLSIYRHPDWVYAVVDNDDLGISECGHPFVQTDERRGLTTEGADRLISILNGNGDPLADETAEMLDRVEALTGKVDDENRP